MSLGINLLMYLTEIASNSLGKNFLSKIFEIHHKHKKDYPSGTALMLGKGIAVGKNKNFYNLLGKKYLNRKTFPYGKKINFNSVRKGEIFGEHEVTFSSGTKTAYGAGSGANYLAFYDSSDNQYNFLFYDGSGDSAPVGTGGTNIEVDLTGSDGNPATHATAFKNIVDAFFWNFIFNYR